MIDMEPAGMVSPDIVLSRSGERMGLIDRSAFRESAKVEVAGETFEVQRTNLGRLFTMTGPGGGEVARGERRGFLTQRWAITAGARQLDLAAAHPFTQRLALVEGGAQIGSARRHPMSRAGSADLPDDLALPEQAFVCFLAQLVWARKRRGGSGGANAGAGAGS